MKPLAGSVLLFTMAALSVPRKGAFSHMNTFTRQQLLLSPQADRKSGLSLNLFSGQWADSEKQTEM